MSYQMILTRPQRESLLKVYRRTTEGERGEKQLTYHQFRKTVEPGPGCIMVPYCGMWLGIEPDGYTHS